MTSRYLRFRAEQVTITPFGGEGEVGEGESAVTAAARRRQSQSQRSESVRGVPVAILATFSGVWYWGVSVGG